MPDVERKRDTRAATVWGLALVVAALGDWIMFDAEPGINWILWTLCAGAGLLAFVRSPLLMKSLVAWLVIFAIIIAGGAAVTAEPVLHALICLSVIMLLALAMLLSVDTRSDRLTAIFALVAPAVAFGLALSESLHRAIDALHLVRSARARALLRGFALTAPVVLAFGLLLASADPTFAGWRDGIQHLLESWSFIPRTIFFFGLLAITLGAFGHASRGTVEDTYGLAHPSPALNGGHGKWLGSTEHLILMSGVSLLFWVFLAVQLSYLFGNLPSITGSGMTFAEYARRGFAELTVVASCTAFLIIVAERYGQADHRRQLLRGVTLSAIVAVLFLLGSAFHRVSLYEEAYGFTTARLYAQAYMVVVAISLVALAREVTEEINPPRLFRRAGLTAILAFIGLIYWNHESWIAERNIELFASTGKLDVVYLTRDLSADAIPTIVSRVPTLPEPTRSQLDAALVQRNSRRHGARWFEWNLARTRAKDALSGL